MQIKLIHATPIDPLIEAASMPYQSRGTELLVKRVWDSGHRSIARHGMASFKVTGISQSLLRQISRHPHINLTVKSSRYCDFSNVAHVTPSWIKPEHRELFEKQIAEAMGNYDYWINLEGYDKEEKQEIAKLILPLGSTTDMIISGNYQALYEMLQLRNCARAEWEIRIMALGMTKELKVVMPIIFDKLGCLGDEYGFCPEHKSCGKYPKK